MAITEDMLTHRDMFVIRRCVVLELGSFNRAALWSRIEFRAHEQNRDAVFEDGRWWWRATQEAIAEDLGLSTRTVQNLLNGLTEEGFIEQAEHGGAYDHTKSYRCVVAPTGSVSDYEKTAHSECAKSSQSSLSVYEDDEVRDPKAKATRKPSTPVRLPDDWVPSQRLIDKANQLKVNWVVELEKMRRWAFANDMRKKDWGRTFGNWIANARPEKDFTPPSAPAARGFEGWFASMLSDANTAEVERILGLVFPMPDEVPPGVDRQEFLADCRRAWLEDVKPQALSRWVVQFGDARNGP